MVTNVSWHPSKCWIINLAVRAKILSVSHNDIIFQFHLENVLSSLSFMKENVWNCCKRKVPWLFLYLLHCFVVVVVF